MEEPEKQGDCLRDRQSPWRFQGSQEFGTVFLKSQIEHRSCTSSANKERGQQQLPTEPERRFPAGIRFILCSFCQASRPFFRSSSASPA